MRRSPFLLGVLILISAATKATVHFVKIVDFQFNPATVNAVIGDTIQWDWDADFHTTTSTDVPVGATDWDTKAQNTGFSFQYKITVEGTYKYKCTPHASLGMRGTINATAVLPVQMVNLAVTATKDNGAQITWNTLTEENTSFFSIKRSADGITFAEIAKINAVGNSTVTQSYSYIDNNTGTENRFLYYMIEIVDKDGRRQLSDIKTFKNNAAIPRLITKMSPNPVSNPGHLMLEFNADKQGKMMVKLYDMNGKFVKQTEMEAVQGLNYGHFHLGDLAPGMYKIVFILGSAKEVKTVVVQ